MADEILLASPECGIQLLRCASGGYAVRTYIPDTIRTIERRPFKTLKAARSYYNSTNSSPVDHRDYAARYRTAPYRTRVRTR